MKTIQTILDSDNTRLDLRNADFPGADLSGKNLWQADLAFANLEKANLTGVQLGGANLQEAYLVGAVLLSADLRDVDFRGANLSSADLTDADLSESYLVNANLACANLTRANLTNANMVEVDLTGANLTDANLIGVGGLGNKQDEIKFAKKILDAIEQELCWLEMRSWPTSLAGLAFPGEFNAAPKASRLYPTLAQYFYATNEEVMEVLRKVAAGELSVFPD